MSTMPSLPIEYLPQSVIDLVDVVGLPAALVIVQERGGIRLCVPVTATRDHWLAKAIGMEAFARLVEVYAREEIEIPRCVDAMRALRAQEIAASDKSAAELARQHGYTERGIRKLKKRVSGQINDDQMEMF